MLIRRPITLLIIENAPGGEDYWQQLQQQDSASYQVLRELYGTQALAVCRSHPIDSIVLRLYAPHISSLNFLHQLKQQLGANCPPIIVLGSSDIQVGVQALKHGATDYLVEEQMTLDELRQTIGSAIDNSRLGRALHYSQERFQTSVENMLDCFGIFSAMRDESGQIVDFRIDYLNQAACENNQMPREMQIGHRLCEVLPGHRESGLFDEYCQLVETNAPLIKESLIYEDTYGGQRQLIRAFDIRASKLDDGFVASWRDVTERKQLELQLTQTIADLQKTEADLRISQHHYRALTEAMPQMVWSADTTGAVNYWNQRWYEYTGLSEAESLGIAGVETVHPNQRDRTLSQWSQAVAQGKSFEIEHLIRRRDGVYRWFINRGIPMRDTQGQITGWIGTITDIDEQKRLEERFRLVVRAVNGLVFDWDLETNKIYRSEQLFDIVGFHPDEVPEQAEWWHNRIHPEDKARLDPQVQELLVGSSELLELEYRVRHRDGHWVDVRDQLCLLRNDQRAVVRVVGSTVDVSDRKQTEIALRQSEDRLRLAIESAQLGIWDWNLTTQQLTWDVGCKAMFGLPPEAETSIDVFFEGLHPGDRDRMQEVVQRTLDPVNGGTYDTEYRTIGIQDGVERWIKAKGQVYFDCNGKPLRFTGTVLDITQQKQVEVEREQLLKREQAAREEAERANQIKDEFLAVLSHELRSPLNPILGWAKLLQTRSFDVAKIAEALATIERNAKVQIQLIDDLLDVAKILRGKLALQMAPTDLAFVVEAAIDTVSSTAAAKHIMLDSTIPQIGQVFGDAARLQQIVWNLLSNAIKFTPKNGRVNIRLEQTGDQAQLTVSDTGKGIKPDFLPYIFESFRQEDTSTARKFGGLGLGLAIVRQLVEAHGGTISATSSGEGMGATFTVRLPLLQVEPVLQQTGTVCNRGLDLTGIRILIVDDEPDARRLLAVALTQHGADVMTATSATEVLNNLAPFQPNLLISDIGMPGVDGYSLIQQIRALPPENGGQIPAIALTAYAREEDHQRAIASGFQRHVTKPLYPEQIVQVVMGLLQANRAV